MPTRRKPIKKIKSFYVTIKVTLAKAMPEDELCDVVNEFDYYVQDSNARVKDTELVDFQKYYI